MSAAVWIIRSLFEIDDETGAPLFWSNDDGWVDRSSATAFSDPFGNLPWASEWVAA